DVAALHTHGENYLLATCDIQVEGVHFQREVIGPYRLGRKAAAINLSDIAAMGGVPTYMLVSLAMPPRTEVSFVDELYRGLQDEVECNHFVFGAKKFDLAAIPNAIVDTRGVGTGAQLIAGHFVAAFVSPNRSDMTGILAVDMICQKCKVKQ
ncbi:MAG: thiamine-monophosphate kinase, partial [bacterium]